MSKIWSAAVSALIWTASVAGWTPLIGAHRIRRSCTEKGPSDASESHRLVLPLWYAPYIVSCTGYGTFVRLFTVFILICVFNHCIKSLCPDPHGGCVCFLIYMSLGYTVDGQKCWGTSDHRVHLRDTLMLVRLTRGYPLNSARRWIAYTIG